MSGFDSSFGAERAAVDDALRRFREARVRDLSQPLADAVDYALGGPGKRVRGILVLLAHAAAGGTRDVAGLAAAVEVVHAYSLVHDDLPCMDDDALRRGMPTVHVRHGVEAATLTGVAMVPLAVIAVLDGAERARLSREVSSAIVGELLRASGAEGMIGGQMRDLDAESQSLSLDDLDLLHASKTGALFGAAAYVGGVAAGDTARAAALGRFGRAMGLSFQIMDDVLDATATSQQLGKDPGRDAALHKSTYPGAVGIEGATARARSLVENAVAELRSAGIGTERLEDIASFTVERAS